MKQLAFCRLLARALLYGGRDSAFAENLLQKWRDLSGWVGTDFLFLLAEHKKQATQGFADDVIVNVEALRAAERQRLHA